MPPKSPGETPAEPGAAVPAARPGPGAALLCSGGCRRGSAPWGLPGCPTPSRLCHVPCPQPHPNPVPVPSPSPPTHDQVLLQILLCWPCLKPLCPGDAEESERFGARGAPRHQEASRGERGTEGAPDPRLGVRPQPGQPRGARAPRPAPARQRGRCRRPDPLSPHPGVPAPQLPPLLAWHRLAHGRTWGGSEPASSPKLPHSLPCSWGLQRAPRPQTPPATRGDSEGLGAPPGLSIARPVSTPSPGTPAAPS